MLMPLAEPQPLGGHRQGSCEHSQHRYPPPPHHTALPAALVPQPPLVRELCRVVDLPITPASLSLRYAMCSPCEHLVSTQLARESRHCKLYRYYLWLRCVARTGPGPCADPELYTRPVHATLASGIRANATPCKRVGPQCNLTTYNRQPFASSAAHTATCTSIFLRR
jgi:hypothetical protein